MIGQNSDVNKGNSVANLQKMTLYNHNVDLVKDNVIDNLVEFCPFILKILRKIKFLRPSRVVTLLQICNKQ